MLQMKKNNIIKIIGLSLFFMQAFAQSEVVVFPQSHYEKEAEALYNTLSLDEKIGQLLLPSLRLLTTSMPENQGSDPSTLLCTRALKETQTPLSLKIKACGFDQIAKYHVGSVFVDGGPFYNDPTLQGWQLLADMAKTAHSDNEKDPLLLLGTDAVHGNMHVAGAVIFPHNINLGATHNPKLIREIAALTAQDVLYSGFNWLYAPTVAVVDDLRWGRTYESYGQDADLVKVYAKEYVMGAEQGVAGKNTGALATAKHFFADGGTEFGFDEGNVKTTLSEKELWLRHGLGYEGAVDAKVGSLMASYSAINGHPMHFGGPWDSINRFKHHFKGFVVSDYNGAWRAAYTYNNTHQNKPLNFVEALAKTINAGVDMLMLGLGDTENPFDPSSRPQYRSVAEVQQDLKKAIDNNLISEARLKDAVVRILATKLKMADKPSLVMNFNLLQEKERELALLAAKQSLVLLKNEKQLLPVDIKAIKNVVVLGDADDLGVQNGGWTVNWQGQKGNLYFEDTANGNFAKSSGATTLLAGLKNRLQAHFFNEASVQAALPTLEAKDTLAIVVLAEPPYAEFMGDLGNHQATDEWYATGVLQNMNSYMPAKQKKTLSITPTVEEFHIIKKLSEKEIPVVTVLYSGRPMVITQGEMAPLAFSNAFIAAFLPGTSGGQAIAEAITGQYYFRQSNHGLSNTLSFAWPRSDADRMSPLFPMGYGLATQSEK